MLQITPDKNKDELFFNVLKYIVIFFPCVIFITHVNKYALNLPRQDDFDAILAYLNDYVKMPFNEKIPFLIWQHNEHRILLTRLTAFLYYKIFGVINFRHIIFINAGLIILVFLILLKFIKNLLSSLWPLAALVLSFCLFDINNFENFDFAMAGLQNIGIILLFLLSLYFYNHPNKLFTPVAILFQIMCVFSSGNGNVASFFLLFFALGKGGKVRIISALITFLVCAPLYYYHYQKIASPFFTLNPAKFLPFFFHAIGAHFGFGIGIAVGIMILGAFMWLTPFTKGFVVKDNAFPFVCILLFMFSSVLVMSIFRSNASIEGSYTSRYFIYSHIIVAILFVFLLIKISEHKYQANIITLSVLMMLFIYGKNYTFGESGFAAFHETLISNEFDYPIKDRAKVITAESCRLKIYCIEAARTQK